MRVVISTESRVHRAPDGSYWCDSTSASREWPRYRPTFDQVGVVARTRVGKPPPSWFPIDPAAAEVIPLPDFDGLRSLTTALRQVDDILDDGVGRDDAVIVRSPGFVSTLLARHARRAGRSYGVEVHGDPAASLGRTVVRHPARRLARVALIRGQRSSCREAAAVLYVTRSALEPLYPASPDALVVEVASSLLDDDAFAPVRTGALVGDRCTVVTVANLAQRYKRVDVLLDAVAECVARGVDVGAVVVGGGALRRDLERHAVRLGIERRVEFLGGVPMAAVRDALDRADIFVLSSQVEAMPRALLEAMARGLPCIATAVGGIPTVLPDSALVVPGDPHRLADQIERLAGDPALRAGRSREHLATAASFAESLLAPRRVPFYRAVHDAVTVPTA